MMLQSFIIPEWPVPPQIKAYTVLRSSGVSPPANTSAETKVDYRRLKQLLQLPADPIRIKQIHSNISLLACSDNDGKAADALFTSQPNQICTITTADCLPILLSHRQGTHIAAIHAGWRGLSQGIIAETIRAMHLPGSDILAWLGPAISQPCYEVGEEVRSLFIDHDPETTVTFIPSPNKRWLVDLYAIARLQLKKCGVMETYGGTYCTYSDQNNFFSYRRDGAVLGVMPTLIWINDSSNSN
jgi:YfiH family protein